MLLYHTHSTPTSGDPLGQSPAGDGVSTTLPAAFVGADASGITIIVRDINGSENRLSGVVEGTSPGQVSTENRAPRAKDQEARQRLAALESTDPSPFVRGLVGALRAKLQGESAENALDQLAQIAETSTDVTQRALAVVTAAFILHDHQ